jgi:hypothetical protein
MVAWPLKPREEHLQHHPATSIKLWLFEVKYERALLCITATVPVGFFLPVVSKMVCVTSNSGKTIHLAPQEVSESMDVTPLIFSIPDGAYEPNPHY